MKRPKLPNGFCKVLAIQAHGQGLSAIAAAQKAGVEPGTIRLAARTMGLALISHPAWKRQNKSSRK